MVNLLNVIAFVQHPHELLEHRDVGRIDFALSLRQERRLFDFELDLGDETPAPAPTPAPEQALDLDFAGESATEAVTNEDAGLVFDLDIGEPDAVAEQAPAAPAPVAPESDLGTATVLDDLGQTATGIDFELPDLELGDTADRFDLNATVVSAQSTP